MDNNSTDMTVAEVARMVTRMEAQMERRFNDLDYRMNSLQFVPKEVYDAKHKVLEDRVAQLEERARWLIRSFTLYLLFPILAAILTAWAVVK